MKKVLVAGAGHVAAARYGHQTLSAFFRLLAYASSLNSKAVVLTSTGVSRR